MSSVVISGDTSGAITVAAPAVAGTNTITLPANTGTVALLQTPSFATTIGVGGATPSTSGAGITFPATQSASTDANTLDDYEEGTWTPTIVGSSTTGTGTYSYQVGRYTKIGNLVNLSCYIAWSAHTGTGNMYLGNLPFTSANISDFYQAGTIGQCNNMGLTANNYPLIYVPFNATTATLVQQPVGGGATSAIPVDAAADLMVSLSYRI